MKAIATDARFTAPVRQFEGRISVFDLQDNWIANYHRYNNLISYTIEKTGDNSKFFGYGVASKLNFKLIDKDRNIDISTANAIKIHMGFDTSNYVYMSPVFYVSEVHRNENNNELSITAYDLLYKASQHTYSEIGLTTYTIKELAAACAAVIGSRGILLNNIPDDDYMFNLKYEEGANFDGSETIREVLDAIAEATQTIYYMACNGSTQIVFRRLDRNGNPQYTIDRENYITLESKTNRRLSKIAHTTELGDNVEAQAYNFKILNKPISNYVETGEEIKYSVDAVGVGLKYQWIYKVFDKTTWSNCTLGTNTEPTLTFAARNYQNGYEYRCKITDAFGEIKLSDIATTYITNINVIKQPENIEAAMGETVSFTVEAENAVSYQWEYLQAGTTTWHTWTDRTEPTFTFLLNSEGRMTHKYRCKMTDAAGVVVYSDAVGVNVAEEDNTPTIITGTTQYLRNNPFYELRDDINILLDTALANMGCFTINQFNCEWRGNYGLEIGDKIAFITKDGETAISYLLDDILEYDGSLRQKTQWIYTDSEETAANPTNLGDALKQTFARVDKANRDITLIASVAESNQNEIAGLKINTDSISASVENIRSATEESFNNVSSNIDTLTQKVEAQITAEDVSLSITAALENGVDRVETSTGFKFNEEGLTVSKTDSEITTQITENGMTVYREEEAVLVADNIGVQARNLHANTYLIIGENSRFENYGSNRTGCFFIGGGE